MFDMPGTVMMAGVAQSVIFWGFILVLVLGLAIGPRYIRSRERSKLYDLMRVAVDKGQPLPPELVASLSTENERPVSRGADSDMRRAVVLIAVGLGLAMFGALLGWGISFASPIGGAITGGIIAGCGAIPGFIGLAFLILWLLGRQARPST